MNLNGLMRLALAFAAVGLASWFWVPAGLLLGLGFSLLFWNREERQGERLRLFVQRLEAGDYGASLDGKDDGVLAEAGAALESLARGLGERFRAAEQSRRRLMAALNGMREGVALCDGEGGVLLMNSAFRRLTNFEEPIARRFFLWEAVRDPEFNAAVEAVLQGGEARTVDLPLAAGRLDGRALVTPTDALPRGQGTGCVIFLFDRTEERKVERLRSEFVSNVSHELRTPLAAIKASLETLQDGALDDPAVNRVFVEKALRHSERLEELLNDLLALGRIEEQRRQGRSGQGRCRLAEAWAEAAALLEDALRRSGVKLELRLPVELPELAIERSSLRQILVNYVDNALKHSASREPISLGAALDGTAVLVWVQDHGQGIPETDQARVFERFFRVDKARARGAAGGSGLGLAIVKHLAESAGGAVGVESQPGRGSRFWVRVPAVLPSSLPA